MLKTYFTLATVGDPELAAGKDFTDAGGIPGSGGPTESTEISQVRKSVKLRN
jgi:hypothetical protein